MCRGTPGRRGSAPGSARLNRPPFCQVAGSKYVRDSRVLYVFNAPFFGEAMHARPDHHDRVMSWSVGSLPIQAGAGSTRACKYFNSNFHVDRARTSTRACNGHHRTRTRKEYKEGGRNAFDCFRVGSCWVFIAYLSHHTSRQFCCKAPLSR